MLPYPRLHHLLPAEFAEPLLTSGDVAQEPIAYEDDDPSPGSAASPTPSSPTAVPSAPAAPSFCPRQERRPCCARPVHTSEPLPLRQPVSSPVLACGAALKSTACLAGDGRALLSLDDVNLRNHDTPTSVSPTADDGRHPGPPPRAATQGRHPGPPPGGRLGDSPSGAVTRGRHRGLRQAGRARGGSPAGEGSGRA
ncbi:hypothetical protein E1292_36945 [Nonomuraea deserti]|uniref:Uncharacterized protein n=1 Tax=Nonomuraea deserti TaxID=1848322 RepID=A0A4R4UZ70_9ACTN|nr:hypothetical protein [Nonomuraea deserti]TDC97520.1 hypothetical protein E1292_36945 [Nonomuraea deserti]